MKIVIEHLDVDARGKVAMLKLIEAVQRLGCVCGEKFVVLDLDRKTLHFKLTRLDRLRFPNACEWIESV